MMKVGDNLFQIWLGHRRLIHRPYVDTAVMKRMNVKKGVMILEMGQCLKNVLIGCL